ncbi:EPIDERMAL PATTERNING FACTOR-like protein 1 [Cornus florida]|uniref:EPIDERMAL PATTERNING FACTOR-like protein 1 n=1 Tax=Cornus florida TaxID=4283 RepID=UPI0028A055A4|nr:EPIDERMAL PATTERNING FACTOR-like protein 1 [Cornus florida]
MFWAMNSLKWYLLSSTTILITILQLLSPSSSFKQEHPSDSTQGLLFEDKTRLGSTPPSCHNKCNQCHPCMAVQVPTLPGRERVQPGSNRVIPVDYSDSSPSSSAGNKYSNYKPLGWKCRCDDHFYNP